MEHRNVEVNSLASPEARSDGRYRWEPARRVYIEKKGTSKKRPLGLPTWSDKLLQEVLRLLLEAYYELQFSDHSHPQQHPPQHQLAIDLDQLVVA